MPDAPNFTIRAISAGYVDRLDNKNFSPVGENIFSLYQIDSKNNDINDILSRSLKQVCSTGKPDKINTGEKNLNGSQLQFENIPVLDSVGKIEYIVHHLIEVGPYHLDRPVPNKITKQLPLNEQRYKALVEDGSDLVGILDNKANYNYVSPSYSTILGFSREELIGKNAFDFIYPDDKNAVFDSFSKILNEKKLNIPPYRFVHKDGSFRWIETSLTNMLENNAVGGIVANCKDVTASRKAAEALKLSEEKYKLLFQNSPLPNWIYDIDTFEILDVNETAIAHYGYTRKEFLKLGLYGLRPPNEVPKVMKVIESVKNKRGFLHFGIFTHLKKNHEIIKVDVSGHKFSFMGRDAVMVVCLDITEKENALQDLRDNQEKLLLVQKIAKLGYWKLQLDTQTLFWSDSAYEIWGVEKENFKVSFDSFFNSIHPDDREEFLKAQSAAITDMDSLDFVHRIILGDGSVKWVHEKGKLIKNEHGTPISFEGSMQDITAEKQLELSLEESNRRYKYVSQATSDAIWDWNLVTDSIYWGEGFELIFGYTIKGLKHDPSSWIDHIHPDDYPRIMEEIDAAIKSSRLNWSSEYRFLKADKTYAYVVDKGFFIRDKNGKALRMVGAMQDISERKNLEALLEKSNRLARIGSWEIDVLKGSVFWSSITKEIREAEPDFKPDLSTGIHYFTEGSHRETISQKVQECIENGKPWDEELQIITQKGNLKWIRTIGEAEFLDGKCIKVYGSFQDIDDRVKAVENIRLSNERFKRVAEATNDAIWDIDLLTNTLFLGEGFRTLYGEDFEKELYGMESWFGHIHPDDRPANEKLLKGALADKKQTFIKSDYRYIRSNGDVAYVHARAAVIRDAEGKAIRMVGAFADQTRYKEYEASLKDLNSELEKINRELVNSNVELERFAYVASHDLQEPLRMVTSFLSQLEKKYGEILDQNGKQYIYFAVDGARRMRQIILDLLELSRVGRVQHNFEEVDLNQVLNDTVLLYQHQLTETNAKIEFCHLPTIITIKGRVRQLFQNLIGNALKYQKTDEAALIVVSAKENETHWQFSIKDNGIGMRQEHFGKIFLMFQRLHNKDEYSGTGIGLAIVKKIIENLGGEIWVESEEGKGSNFFFTIKKYHLTKTD